MNTALLDTKKIFSKPVRARYKNLRGFFIVLPSEPFREAFGGASILLEVEYSKGKIVLTERSAGET